MRKTLDKKVECTLMHSQFYCDICGKHIADTVYYDTNTILPEADYHQVNVTCTIEDEVDPTNKNSYYYNPINNQISLELCEECWQTFRLDTILRLKAGGFKPR